MPYLNRRDGDFFLRKGRFKRDITNNNRFNK